MKMLRFTTSGSVDHGKSTLIGRMFHDSKAIFDDVLKQLKSSSEITSNIDSTSHTSEDLGFNLAFITDGLRSERERGITIDVAYRYFSTPKRKFIVADAPGHKEFTRNMITAASNSELILILVDAVEGITEQTLRHTYIASLLGIKRIVICVNKIDLVHYSEIRFNEIQTKFHDLSKYFHNASPFFVPICALNGDNVIKPSKKMDWYTGPTLMEYLETIDCDDLDDPTFLRLPIQMHVPGLGYVGTIASGKIKENQEVVSYPSRKTFKIRNLVKGNRNIFEAEKGHAISFEPASPITLKRGEILALPDHPVKVGRRIRIKLFWMEELPLTKNRNLHIRIACALSVCTVTDIHFKFDLNSGEKLLEDNSILMNEIGEITIESSDDLAYDSFSENNQATGRLIFINPETGYTAGAGTIC